MIGDGIADGPDQDHVTGADPKGCERRGRRDDPPVAEAYIGDGNGTDRRAEAGRQGPHGGVGGHPQRASLAGRAYHHDPQLRLGRLRLHTGCHPQFGAVCDTGGREGGVEVQAPPARLDHRGILRIGAAVAGHLPHQDAERNVVGQAELAAARLAHDADHDLRHRRFSVQFIRSLV